MTSVACMIRSPLPRDRARDVIDRPPGRRWSARARRGFSLAETLMALGVFSILLIGVGAAMSIAVRAVDDGSSATARTARAAAGISQMCAEIASATSFTTRTSHAVEFTVPDRTGDSAPETIRYEWSAGADTPINRTFNGGTPVAVTGPVGGFDLTYASHSTVSRVTASNTTSTTLTLASFSGWTGILPTNMDYRLTSSAWADEYIRIDPSLMPTGSGTVSVTNLQLRLRGVAGAPGTVTVAVYRAVGGGSILPS